MGTLLMFGIVGLGAFLVFLASVFGANPNGRYLRRKMGSHVTGNKMRDKGVTWEARMALRPNYIYPFIRPLAFSIAGTLALTAFMIAEKSKASGTGEVVLAVMGLLMGWGLGFAAAYPLFLGKQLKRYCALCSEEAARSLGRLTDKRLAQPLLDEAALQTLPRLRAAAVAGYLEIGSPECLRKLERLTQDSDSTVALVAKLAHQELQRRIEEGVILSVLPMDNLIERVRYCRWQLDHRSSYLLRVDYEQKLEASVKAIEDITRSQQHLRGAFPTIYCMQCFAHAERVEADEWEWVRCHRCKDATALIYDVDVVVAQVGGVVDWELAAGTLKISLWDEEKREARVAEADRLEIIGGQPIQYDWAVSAVVEKLNNAAPDGKLSIPIHLLHQPKLSPNTMAVLQRLSPPTEIPTA